MRKPKTAYDPRQLEFTSLVGGFFENTAQRLLNATSCHPDTGDLMIPDIRVVGEVKAGNSRHPLRIRIDQLRAHQKLLESNASLCGYAYCLFAYSSKESKLNSRHKPRSELSHCRSKEEFIDYMCGKTIRTYIVDIGLLGVMHKRFGDRRGGVIGRPFTRHLCLNHMYLKRFVKEGAAPLEELKMDRREWIVDSRHVLLPAEHENKKLNLQVTMVLPKRLFRKVSSVIYTPIPEGDPF